MRNFHCPKTETDAGNFRWWKIVELENCVYWNPKMIDQTAHTVQVWWISCVLSACVSKKKTKDLGHALAGKRSLVPFAAYLAPISLMDLIVWVMSFSRTNLNCHLMYGQLPVKFSSGIFPDLPQQSTASDFWHLERVRERARAGKQTDCWCYHFITWERFWDLWIEIDFFSG